MIGIVSYLLINFWFTRIQANKAAILALTMNRVGDMGLSIGYFALFALFGSLDYATIFSIVPFMNETALTIIGLLLLTGAMAKSAQIPLHSWLPGSMEGFKGVKHYILIIIFILTLFLSDWSDDKLVSLIPIIHSIPKLTLNSITGNMLGDGNLSLSRTSKGKAKYSMTMDVYSLNYLNHLDQTIYSQITDTKIYAYPNISLAQHKGKEINHYHLRTKTHLLFTALHDLWYKWDNVENKFIKIIPSNILDMFSEVSLAYWIMDDGYFDSHGRTQTVLLCTESFSKEECISLQSVLEKLSIKST